jgi:hypothetical protein
LALAQALKGWKVGAVAFSLVKEFCKKRCRNDWRAWS